MGIFKTIFNELFGSKKMYEVKDLGIFTSKVCDWWLDKEYSWGNCGTPAPLFKGYLCLGRGGMLPPRHHSNWRTCGSYCKTGSQ